MSNKPSAPIPSRHLILLVPVIAFALAAAQNCRALDYVWSAGANGNWSAATNWTPNGIPGAADTVTFNNTSVMQATVDANFSVLGVTIASNYSGTVLFSNSARLAIGANGFSQAGGTFNFSAAGGVSCASNWLATAGNSTCTTATVVLTFNEPAGNFTFTQQASAYGAITHSGDGNIICVDSFGLFTQGLLTQSGSGTFTLSSKQQLILGGITVSAGTLDTHFSTAVFCGFGPSFILSGGTFAAPVAWSLRGPFSKTGGTFVAGSGSITIEPQASNTLDCGGAVFNNFQYFSSANLALGNSDLNVAGTFTIFRQDSRLGTFDCNGRNVTVGGLTSVTNGTLNCGTGTLNLNGGLFISGDTVPNIPPSSSGTVNVGSATINTTDMTLKGTNGGANFGIGTLTLGTGRLNVAGNWSRPSGFTNASVLNVNTGTVGFTKATGAQTFDLTLGGTFFNVTHSGAGTLSILNTSLTVNGAFVNSSGTFLTNGLNLVCNGSATLTRPAGGTSLVDSGSGTASFQSALTLQGATVNSGPLGASFYTPVVLVSDGVGGDKSTLSGNVNLSGLTVNFNVASGSELLVPATVSNGALTKSGPGTLTLSAAANTYAGATTVLGGALVVNSLQSASTVTVNAGGTLAGNGTVGPVTIANGGALSPNAGPNAGALTAVGNATLSAGSTYKVGLRGAAFGQFDKFFVQGTVSLDGSALTGTATPFPTPPGTKLVIVDNNGVDPIVGTFTGQPEGSTVALGGRLFKISYVGGTGNDVELTTINSAPVLNGSLAATPNPAGLGQNITFTAAATDVDGDTLTYVWDFGDGSTGSGASVAHLYTAAGTYTATVSVNDGTAAPISASVSVTVIVPVVGTGIDTDGDGFSDSFETAVGTLPNDATSTPLGGAAATAPLALTVTKPAFALNFAKSGSDTIKFGGTLDVPAGFVALNKTVYVDVGGVAERFTLDKAGSAKHGASGTSNTIKIAIKATKGTVAAQKSAFTVSFSKGDFKAALADEMLTNATVTNQKRTIVFTVIFNTTIFQKSQDVLYTAKQGKTGKAK